MSWKGTHRGGSLTVKQTEGAAIAQSLIPLCVGALPLFLWSLEVAEISSSAGALLWLRVSVQEQDPIAGVQLATVLLLLARETLRSLEVALRGPP